MKTKKQITTKDGSMDKRTYNAAFTLIPTSILINQTLARLQFSREKKLKSVFGLKEAYKFR